MSTYTTPHHLPAAMEPHATIASGTATRSSICSACRLLQCGASAMSPIARHRCRRRCACSRPMSAAASAARPASARRHPGGDRRARRLGRPVKVALTRRADLADRPSPLRHAPAHAHRLPTRRQDPRPSGTRAASRRSPTASFIEPVALGRSRSMRASRGASRNRVVHARPAATGAVRAPGEAVGMLALETRDGRDGRTARHRPDRVPQAERAGARSRYAARPSPPAGCSTAMTRARDASAGSSAMPTPGQAAKANG